MQFKYNPEAVLEAINRYEEDSGDNMTFLQVRKHLYYQCHLQSVILDVSDLNYLGDYL